MKRAIIIGMVLAVVLGTFALPLTAAAQKGNAYDYIMQDDSGCPVLKFNSTTGQYLFYNSEGLVLAGVGSLRGTTYWEAKLTFRTAATTVSSPVF